MNKEMMKGTIDLMVLSILNERDSYGYEISKAIKKKTEGAFEILEATIYLSLKRLDTIGAITSYWGDETQGGRRKYYKITADGKNLLQDMIGNWIQIKQIVGKFI